MKKLSVSMLLITLSGCVATLPTYQLPESSTTAQLKISTLANGGWFNFAIFDNPDHCQGRRYIDKNMDPNTTQDVFLNTNQQLALQLGYAWGNASFISGSAVTIIKFTPQVGSRYQLRALGQTNALSWELVDENDKAVAYTEYTFTTPWDDNGQFCRGNTESATS